MPCTTGTADCPAGTFGYSAGTAYDQVTGLGSVDVNKLITAWKAFAPSADFSIEALQTGVSAAGDTATSTITMESHHGFIGTVTLSCALTPPSTTVQITCGFTAPTAGATTLSYGKRFGRCHRDFEHRHYRAPRQEVPDFRRRAPARPLWLVGSERRSALCGYFHRGGSSAPPALGGPADAGCFRVC